MTPPSITALYAGLGAIVFCVLSYRVILGRRRHGVSLGDGGREDLARPIRAHANFAEYVPLALLLILVLEWNGLPAWALHALGLALIAGRLMHAVALARRRGPLRVAGMALTLTMIGVAGLLAVSAWIWRPLPTG